MRRGKLAFLAFLILSLTLFLSSCGVTSQPPSASFTASPTSGEVPLEVSFDASGSSDPDGSIISYDWDFGDGSTGSGENTTLTYDNTGNYQAQLTVTDDGGSTDTTTRSIEVVNIGELLETLAADNLQYAESEDLQGYMSTIHSDAPGYSTTEQTMQNLFSTYDLNYELQSFEYLGREGEYALAEIEQLTEKVSGPSFQDNIMVAEWKCKKEDGEWKIWSTTVFDVTYI